MDQWTVKQEKAGQRLDNFLIRCLKGVPRSRIYRLIREGKVRVNGKRAKADARLEQGDQLVLKQNVLYAANAAPLHLSPKLAERLSKAILYEDKDILIINKPDGWAVHGGSGVSLGIIEAVRLMFPEHNWELAHRLDKETSGCLILAKTGKMLRALHEAFASGEGIQKTYEAVLQHPMQHNQVVTAPLFKLPNLGGGHQVRVDPEGKPACTEFYIIGNTADATWVRAVPKTGRTHQIRVHAAYLGHAILGDSRYGTEWGPGMFLHAAKLSINCGGLALEVEAPWPTAKQTWIEEQTWKNVNG